MAEILNKLEDDAGKGKDKDASFLGRCGGMRKQISKEIQVLKEMKDAAWKSEIIKAGLLGPTYSQHGQSIKSQVLSPVEIDTGNRTYYGLAFIIILHVVIEHYFDPLRHLPAKPFLLALLAMVVGLHVISAVSRADAELVLATSRVIVAGTFFYDNVNPSPAQRAYLEGNILSHIPLSMATAIKRFNIEPEITEYACCPKCFAIYTPLKNSSDDAIYPETCSWKETPDLDEPCGEQLTVVVGNEANGKTKPRRTYGIHDPVAWLSRLLARDKTIETFMEQSWSMFRNKGEIKDVFDGEVLRDFKGPDGKPWSNCPNDELHLVFSMFVDWFNPYGNKQAGKSSSIGAIYMVCLSLPPAIRYKAENVFLVSIIPGPKEPNVEQLNRLLKPIVDDFLKLWNPGIRLSCTAAKQFGRVVKCAIVPVVCDLPALRKTAGFAGHAAHNFCSFCRVKKADIADNFNFESWPRRGWKDHLCEAERWKNADSNSEREKIFKRHGLRWTELLRLPYWDPTRFAVLDAMHNLFLGEFQHHCRRVWGVSIKTGRKAKIPHSPQQQLTELKKGVSLIQRKAETRLANLRKGYLAALASLNGVEPEGTTRFRRDYARALITWVCMNYIAF
jgi:hypothetical protein